MMTRFYGFALLLIAGVSLLLGACASNGGLVGAGEDNTLPLIPGQATLKVDASGLSALQYPEDEQVYNGKILVFSPIEFRSQKDRFNFEANVLPLGRYIAVRHSGEGVRAGLSPKQARSFTLHYEARYPDLKAARRDFPGLSPSQFRERNENGKTYIEIYQWQLRLSMIFSRKHDAFRVLLDDLVYHAPIPRPSDPEEGYTSLEAKALPVVVAFSYQHPDAKKEMLVQQNVFFEFPVENRREGTRVSPQISGWIPLSPDTEVMPYTVGIVVAEVHETREDFYKKLFNMIRNVRGII